MGRLDTARRARRRIGLSGQSSFLTMLFLVVLAWAPAALASQAPLYAWVQVGPDDRAQARAIMSGTASCPGIEIDGQVQAMRLRAPAQAGGAFAVTACQAALPTGARSARIGEQVLPLPHPAPRRIAVIGDTGCRIKGGHVQDCDDPEAWPFPALATAVAAARPDLVVHVGDYLYRESPCPDDDHGCAGSHWGYNWGTWQEDFFAPAAPLLAQAPFLFLRGNHETCKRAWRGWYRFLAETAWTPECHDYAAPYALTVEGRRLIVLDTTHADDRKAKPHQVAAYADLLRQANSLAAERAGSGGGESAASGPWLVTHKPFWSVHQVHGAGGRHPHADGGTAVLQAAEAQVPLAEGFAAVLSGHYHLFQALSFAPEEGISRPAQLIVGTGGTALDDGPDSLPANFDAWGMAVADYTLLRAFGFALLEVDGADWVLVLHDMAGTAMIRCALSGRSLRCAPAGGAAQ